ncbi:unnamed protein product [Mytilus edulis]|uniref:Endonuclease/exonuclease/phosphatase domain-containing protein n=1 Tax=Mytilus edulis TaxID=6550 RepID=A0A8S3R6P8_MYTED|nr:unnamed protein product [Mytilus edulis]
MRDIFRSESRDKVVIVISHNPFLMNSITAEKTHVFFRKKTHEYSSKVSCGIHAICDINRHITDVDNLKKLIFAAKILCVEGVSDKIILEGLFDYIVGSTYLEREERTFLRFRYNIQNCELAIEHYEMYSANVNNDIGRGVNLYIHESIEATQVDFETDYEESVWVLVSGDKLLIGCIYRSPNGQDNNDESLRKLFKDVVSRDYSHILLMGDFNYDKINWETWSTPTNEQSREYKFIECLRDCFLYQHVLKPTRGRINQDPHILDLLLTNEEETNSERIKFYYDKADLDGLRTDLSNIDWYNIMKEKSTNEQWIFFKDKLLELQSKHIPHKKIGQSSKKNKAVGLNQETLKAIRKKHRCWTRYMETKSSKNIENSVKPETRSRNLPEKQSR